MAVNIIPIYIRSLYNTLDFSSFDSLLRYPTMIWLFYKVKFYTMLDILGLKVLFRLARKVDKLQIQGDIVECGVYNGGSAAVMAYAVKTSSIKRNVWLFDSFEGLPVPTKHDGKEAFKQYYKGFCTGTVQDVKEIFSKLNMLDKRLHIIKGWFKNTFPKTKIEKIALLHIDADWYESVAICLEKFYDSVEEGGFIVLDDYNCWEGCKKATDEFIEKHKLKVKLIRGNSTSCYFQKPFIIGGHHASFSNSVDHLLTLSVIK